MANLLGIHIGKTSVLGVLVKSQLRRVQLVSYLEVPIEEPVAPPLGYAEAVATLPVPEGAAFEQPGFGLAMAKAIDAQAAAVSAEASSPQASPLGRAVAELIQRAGGTSVDVIATLSGEVVSLRRIELPKAAERKLDELLPFEMESLLPFDVADTLLDHQAIDADPKLLRLLVSAAPKARIREELDRLAGVGADPVELVPAPAALAGLAQFVPALATDGPHLIVALGLRTTDVCVLRKGRAELARTLSVGREDLMGATRNVAYGTPALDEAAAIHLGREIKQTLLAYRMQGGPEPETMSLGGEADVPGIFEWLGAHLDKSFLPLALPEIVGSPSDSVARMRFATPLGAVGHSLLRGKHLDFRKGEFVKKRNLGVIRDFGPILGIASMAVGFAFFFSIWARWSVLDDRRQLLEDELARVTESRLGEETRDAARARALLETGRRSSDPMPTFTAYDALIAVNRSIPEGVTHDLSRITIDLGDGRSEGHLEIQGTVGSVDDAERISRALGEVECLQSLELGPSTTTPDGRRNYRIEADILCPGGAAPSSGSRRGRRRSGSGSGSGGEG